MNTIELKNVGAIITMLDGSIHMVSSDGAVCNESGLVTDKTVKQLFPEYDDEVGVLPLKYGGNLVFLGVRVEIIPNLNCYSKEIIISSMNGLLRYDIIDDVEFNTIEQSVSNQEATLCSILRTVKHLFEADDDISSLVTEGVLSALRAMT